MRPRILDLFCGAGGAAVGYQRAGFDVVGVDLVHQPRYPFEFIQGDALEYVAAHGHEFDVVHASPPCQAYSIMRNLPWLRDREYPRLIDPVRDLLQGTGVSWVIENVMGAHLDAGWLCGTMFGQDFYRHRAFETNWFWLQPGHASHRQVIRGGRSLGSRARDVGFIRKNGHRYGFDQPRSAVGHAAVGGTSARQVLGVPWMSRDEATQAIPPAYTEFIGRALIQQLEGAKV